jgi:hypothetical protein
LKSARIIVIFSSKQAVVRDYCALKNQGGSIMKMLKLSFCVAVALVMITGLDSSFAQKKDRPHMKCQERFKAMDVNKDGKVTFEEFKAVKHPRGNTKEVFKSKDKNNDGFLTMDELCAGKGPGTGRGKGRFSK